MRVSFVCGLTFKIINNSDIIPTSLIFWSAKHIFLNRMHNTCVLTIRTIDSELLML